MDAAGFLADLEAKPATLLALLDQMPSWPDLVAGPLVLTGMGSSWFAADVAARRMRRHGVTAVADLASVEATLPPSPARGITRLCGRRFAVGKPRLAPRAAPRTTGPSTP